MGESGPLEGTTSLRISQQQLHGVFQSEHQLHEDDREQCV